MTTNLRMALKALLQNRVQAMLTLCGMSVGVAMVVIVSGLGRGAQLTIESQIESAGPTQIMIRAGNLKPAAIMTSGEQDTSGGEVAEGGLAAVTMNGTADVVVDSAVEDARARAKAPKMTKHRSPVPPLGGAEMRLLEKGIANVRSVSGTVEGNVTLDANAGLGTRIVRVQGIDAAVPELRAWKLAHGRFINEREYADNTPAVIVSAAVAKRLWPTSDALGQVFNAGGKAMKVVGVIVTPANEPQSAIIPTILVPVTLAQQLLGRDSYDLITVRTKSVAVTTSVAKEIKDRLRELRALPPDTLDDFRVETQSVSAMPSMGMDPRLARAVHSNVVGFEQASWEEMAKSLRSAGRTFTLLLAAAAAVSLLVGGIGVMNIMLVSVAARTREIGLRMALGARMGDVMAQFMVEAVTLAALGGLIGLILGTVGLMFARYGFHWATAVSPSMLVAAIAMAAITGVVFGYGPARRAAVLDPVVALKSE